MLLTKTVELHENEDGTNHLANDINNILIHLNKEFKVKNLFIESLNDYFVDEQNIIDLETLSFLEKTFEKILEKEETELFFYEKSIKINKKLLFFYKKYSLFTNLNFKDNLYLTICEIKKIVDNKIIPIIKIDQYFDKPVDSIIYHMEKLKRVFDCLSFLQQPLSIYFSHLSYHVSTSLNDVYKDNIFSSVIMSYYGACLYKQKNIFPLSSPKNNLMFFSNKNWLYVNLKNETQNYFMLMNLTNGKRKIWSIFKYFKFYKKLKNQILGAYKTEINEIKI
ncbi:hypothetical protein [Mycoplasma nasistruthionis]|uniref:Uncharacterized protein n=1 Tax=Mycoplasma nasistruthionis TaxID=353852 RepID=A0A4Y6I6J5_9MOLU|nr:hypothetical protein [Mycoplasma nasistruthionis]QDF64819.1 hypothetical protein FIV53_00620 [Mycoplasma nasistruthionis]